jgi:hypothetical protein
MNPNHRVIWRSPRPDFSILLLWSTSTNRGYHESLYEVIGRRGLDTEDFKHLDACGLLGSGQCYRVDKHTSFHEEAPAITIDRRTGLKVDVPPVNAYTGEPVTKTVSYEWFRYEVMRICDSGD